MLHRSWRLFERLSFSGDIKSLDYHHDVLGNRASDNRASDTHNSEISYTFTGRKHEVRATFEVSSFSHDYRTLAPDLSGHTRLLPGISQ